MDKPGLVELRPCPFCGGEAQRFTIEDEPTNAGGDCIGCLKCGASSHVEFGRKENLVSSWNTRTPEAADRIARLEEALRAIAFECHETIPPDGKEAAFGALSTIAKIAVAALNGGSDD